MRKTAIKRKTGRPSKYDPLFCQRLLAFVEKGGRTVYKPLVVSVGNNGGSEIVNHPVGKLPARLTAFARTIGADHSSVETWRTKHPEFGAAYATAKIITEEQKLDGVQAGYLNPAGVIIDLKNNHGYRDRHEVEAHGDFIVSYPPDWKPVDAAVGVRMGSNGATVPAPSDTNGRS